MPSTRISYQLCRQVVVEGKADSRLVMLVAAGADDTLEAAGSGVLDDITELMDLAGGDTAMLDDEAARPITDLPNDPLGGDVALAALLPGPHHQQLGGAGGLDVAVKRLVDGGPEQLR